MNFWRFWIVKVEEMWGIINCKISEAIFGDIISPFEF